MPLFMNMLQLFLHTIKKNMLSIKLNHPVLTIRNSQIISSLFQYPISFLYHLSHINQRIFRTHQSINRRFINHQIKIFITICHLPYIHHIISHLLHTPLLFTFLHLLYHHWRYIIIVYFMVPILIKLLLNRTTTASDVQYHTVLPSWQTLLNKRLWSFICLLWFSHTATTTKTSPLSS